MAVLFRQRAETLCEFRYSFSVEGSVLELALGGERWPFTHFRGAKGDDAERKAMMEWVPESELLLHPTMAETLGEFRYSFLLQPFATGCSG